MTGTRKRKCRYDGDKFGRYEYIIYTENDPRPGQHIRPRFLSPKQGYVTITRRLDTRVSAIAVVDFPGAAEL